MDDYLKGLDFGIAMSDRKNKDRFTNKYYQNSLDKNYIAKNFDELNVNAKKPNLSRNGHRQRMRQSYLSGSMENAPDHNLLELFLSIIIPQKDVKELAYELINTFGSLEGVLNADAKQLMNVNGVGESAAIGIKMVVELNKRVMMNRNNNVINLNCSEEAINYCKNILSYEKVEKLIMITVNNDGSIINTHTLGIGNANASSANHRDILENAIIDHASGVLFAHNHPSGSSQPSEADINFSVSIGGLLRDVSINFIDHIIIGNDEPFSLRMSNSSL